MEKSNDIIFFSCKLSVYRKRIFLSLCFRLFVFWRRRSFGKSSSVSGLRWLLPSPGGKNIIFMKNYERGMIGCEGVPLCHIGCPAQPQVTLHSQRQWSVAECEHIYVMSHIFVMRFVFTVCYFVKISALSIISHAVDILLLKFKFFPDGCSRP